jgi:mannose-6-phosphate isomerase-like protein (cupin superfamily)
VKFAVDELLSRLPLPPTEKWPDGVADIEAFRKGKVSLVFFAPRGEDRQTSHDEDEFYFIVRGSGDIVIGGEHSRVTSGDAIFVQAGEAHRFENFTSDFSTWAVFF